MSQSQHHLRWREHLNNIEKMRCERNAPVDFMGCEQISDKSAAPEVSIIVWVRLLFICCIVFSMHLTLLELTLAVAFLSIRLSNTCCVTKRNNYL